MTSCCRAHPVPSQTFLDFCPAGAQNEHGHNDHSVCQIAEHYDRDIGQDDFQIGRFVRKKRNNREKCMIIVRFSDIDPLFEDKGPGAITVADAITEPCGWSTILMLVNCQSKLEGMN